MRGQNGAKLSFYLQPRGLGNRPERQDSFLVQFLRPDGNYETVLAVEGQLNTVSSSQELPFIPYVIDVDNRFLYNGFNFRFANKSSERGAVDMWHLDYVKLSAEAGTSGLATDDVALVDAPGFILGPLTSLPLRHFKAAPAGALVQPDIDVTVYNAADRTFQLSLDKASLITVLDGDFNIVQGELAAGNVFGLMADLPAMEYVSAELNENWMGLSAVESFLRGLPEGDDPITLTTRFNLSIGGAPGQPVENVAFSPKYIQGNNVANSITTLDEYMAYDDGTAEALIEAQEQTVIVQRYTAFVEDTLRGVRIRIPRGLGELGNQQLRLVVYAGDDEPGARLYSEDFDIFYAEDFFRDSLQGYTTYRFTEPLALAPGNFFVGFEQLRADRSIGVGYDRNNNSQDFQFFDVSNNGEWRNLRGTVTGALMVRPLLGGFTGPPTNVREAVVQKGLVEAFPNPTTGLLHLRPRQNVSLDRLQVKICDVAGAVIEVRAGSRTLDLGSLPKGVYILTVSDGARQSNHKVVLH